MKKCKWGESVLGNITLCTAEKFFRGYPFEVIRVEGKDYIQRLHCHDYVQIWYVKKGPCVHVVNEIEYELSTGDIFILPPNVPHRIVCENGINKELIGCGFLAEFLEGNSEYLEPFMVEADEVKPFLTLSGVSIKKIESIFEEILFEYQRKEKYFDFHIRSNILKMLTLLARVNYANSNPENAKMMKHKDSIKEIIAYMKEHCCEKIYIQDVRKMADLSPTYFSNVFKYITGRTFSEYLRFLKIEKAKEMLLDVNESKTISEIAYELGFDDHCYFDRVFKNEVGISPKKYKELYKFF